MARINGTACKCGSKHLYLFGGMDVEKNEFTDIIERYNQELELWTVLQIKLPLKISNCYSFSFNSNYILIMGGITKKKINPTPQQFISSISGVDKQVQGSAPGTSSTVA